MDTLHLLPHTKHYRRRSVQATQRYLRLRGHELSHASIRRYGDLIGTSRVRLAKRTERVYTSRDLERLELVVILKRLGFSNAEVTTWLAHPDYEQVTERLRGIEITQDLGEALLKQLRVVDASVRRGSAATDPGATHSFSQS